MRSDCLKGLGLFGNGSCMAWIRQIHRCPCLSHGFLDERFPLNSALVLTIPDTLEEGHDNGLLQAWEIFEQVRLDRAICI